MVTFATVIVVPMLLFTISFIALGNYLIGEKGELRGYTSIVGNYDTFDLDTVQAFHEAEANPDRLQDVEFLDSLSAELHDRNVYLVVRRDEGLYYASDEAKAAADLSSLPEWEEEAADRLQRGETEDPDHAQPAGPEGDEKPHSAATAEGAGASDISADPVQAAAAGRLHQNQIVQVGRRSLLVRQLDF